MSTTQKPLPALPRRPIDSRLTTTLTIEARAHLSRFIRHSFEDDRPSFSENKSEAWAAVLEGALDELGECIARGGWLTGIKRARMARKARRDADRRRAEEEKAKKDKDVVGTSKGKPSRRRTELPAEEAAAERRDQEERKSVAGSVSLHPHSGDATALALVQIGQLVSHPAVPTPRPSAKHLVLSVVPLGSRFDAPAQDGWFDLLPANIGCVFSTGMFFMPVSERSADSVVLYGLHEWDGQQFFQVVLWHCS
jgi:1-phosphatidylinositol-3-phosphate 5-kinase